MPPEDPISNYPGQSSISYSMYSEGSSYRKKYNNGLVGDYGTGFVIGDLIGVAFDATNGTLEFFRNGISEGVAFTGIPSRTYLPAVADGTSGGGATLVVNFGQKPFKFPPPAGFQPLTLANLPRPTIVRPDQYVGIVTYSGNSSSNASGTTQSLTGLNFNGIPDLVWIKNRNVTGSHAVFDSVRGATNWLATNNTNQESSNANYLKSFNYNGFTLGSDNLVNGDASNSGGPYVAWCWKAGGNSNTYNIDGVGYATTTAAGLTSGNITGASVNTKSGFSIIKLTTSASSGTYTVSHGLGKSPAFFITKRLNGTSQWWTYHTSVGYTGYLNLCTTAGAATDYSWGAAPTSTTITYTNDFLVGSSDYIIYSWAEIPGFSKFGSYTGNNSADGPVIITGFRPKIIIFKRSDSSSQADWRIMDSTRSPYNVADKQLFANLSSEELSSSNYYCDFLSNGFKIRNNWDGTNGTSTIIYACFAETPSFNLYGGQANAR